MTEEHTSYEELQAVAALVADFRHPWFVSGGWAIDLFLGRVSRLHEDIEVGIFRSHQRDARWLLEADWRLEKAVATDQGMAWVPWYEGEYLELPIHQVRASNQMSTPTEFQLFLNDESGTEWFFRRNAEIRRPKTSLALRSADGISFLRPEIQLLYKARLMREKDAHDFHSVIGSIDGRGKAWLRGALKQFLPDHEWLGELEENQNG